MRTLKYLRLSSAGSALIPGAAVIAKTQRHTPHEVHFGWKVTPVDAKCLPGSLISLCVSCAARHTI